MSTEVAFYGVHRNRLGESPLWDPRDRRLYWVDTVAQRIFSADANGGALESWETPSMVGSIALAETGLLAALREGFYTVESATGECAPLSLPERGNDLVRFNDGKADRQGRFLAGTMRHAGAEGAPGKLYRLDSASATVIERDIMLSNGLCFSPDGATMYFADSLRNLIWAYDYDGASGDVTNRRVFLETAGLGSAPDGATVDADGFLWVALVQAQKLARISPHGDLVAEIATPMPFPACPAFGGEGMATLYVTSIRDAGMLKTDHADGGRMLAITGLEVPGIAEAICRLPIMKDLRVLNLDFSPEETAFRDEVRAFFAENVRPDYRTALRAGLRPTPQQLTDWQRCLAARGWGAPTWPREHGGTGWTPTELYIFESEAARADAPIQFHQGLELIGPIIFTYGSPEQKAYYLPRIISGEDWWCQGYSEPGAGSDLAALSTRAVRDGDEYVLNGQKMWTSYAHVATQMFCLARTSAESRKQAGISLILVDMTTPGLKIRPVDTLDEKHHTNEVFLDDVRVPAANLVGDEGMGWSYGKVLLDRERGVGAATALRLPAQLRAVREAATRIQVAGAPLIDRPAFGARLAQAEIEALTIETMVMRLMAEAAAGLDSGPRASMLKLRWSELLQQITELWAEALGYDAAMFESLDGAQAPVPEDMPLAIQGALYSRVTSIYGGSSEIQRNIIARRSLGL